MKFTFYIFFSLALLFPIVGNAQEASVNSASHKKPGLGIGAIPVNPNTQPTVAPSADSKPSTQVNTAPVQTAPTPPVAPVENAPANAAIPEAAEVAATPAAPEAAKAPELVPYVMFNGVSAKTLNTNMKSIMFNRDVLPNYYKKVLSGKISTKDTTPQTTGQSPSGDQEPPQSIVAPSFFLSSILLPDDGNWSVWVNKNKIRNYQPKADKIEIVSVTKTQIEAKFQDPYLYKMSPFIQTKLKQSENQDWDYESEKGDIKVNLTKGIVYFRIRQNQSFSTYDMEIFEGFVDSKTVSFDPENPDAAPTAVDGSTEGADLLLNGDSTALPATPVNTPVSAANAGFESAQPLPVQPNPGQ